MIELSVLLLWISIGLSFSPVSRSQIQLGSSLSLQENNYWASPNGDFEIGFLNNSCQYSFGVRFSSSFGQTVVWVAGGNTKVGINSSFELTDDGELILFDSATGGVAWKSNTANAGVESALLRDDGNFVLLNQAKKVVWESFGSPSDTLLPGQNLSVDQILRASSKSAEASHHVLYMNVSGQLQLKWDSSVIYWTLGDRSRPVVRVALDPEGILRGHDRRSKPVWSVYGEDFGDRNVKFRFLKIDFDGNLRLYSWRNRSRSWRSVWQAVENQCNVFATCGLRGICRFNSSSGSSFCDCPFKPEGDSSSECLVPYQPNCASGISMIRHDHMFLYGIFPPNETVVQMSLQRCQRLCSEDPLCYAVSFINNGAPECRIKKSQYVSGWFDPSSSSVSFVKTCSDPIAVIPAKDDSVADSSSGMCNICVAEIAGASAIIYLMIQFGIVVFFHRRSQRDSWKKSISPSLSLIPKSSGYVTLTYSVIVELTENFKNRIGPTMFKGVLRKNNLVVAVRELDGLVEERPFRSIVQRIGNIHHKNLLRLYAFCCDLTHRFLVYDFSKNGSLATCLADPKFRKKLTWRKRMDICRGVARAVSYLHTGCREFIPHGNLRCENVVLDDSLEAKVGEYALREVLPEPSNRNSEGPAQTDVKDFGMMMLVLITGVLNADEACKQAYEKWVGSESGNSSHLTDIESGIDSDELERALRLSFWCLQDDERMRPSMSEIVKVLEGLLDVDPPPPLFCHRDHHQSSSPEM